MPVTIPKCLEDLDLSYQFIKRCLSASRTDHHRRNIFHIYEGVEKFCAGQVGKIDDIVGNLADSPSDFFSRSQVQLDSFARAGLKDAEYSRIRLDSGFFLRGQVGTSHRGNNDSEKN